MLTQCPHCQAKFKVTEAQLQIAQGFVRCGMCQQPFNARKHLEVVEKSVPTVELPPEQKPEPKSERIASHEAHAPSTPAQPTEPAPNDTTADNAFDEYDPDAPENTQPHVFTVVGDMDRIWDDVSDTPDLLTEDELTANEQSEFARPIRPTIDEDTHAKTKPANAPDDSEEISANASESHKDNLEDIVEEIVMESAPAPQTPINRKAAVDELSKDLENPEDIDIELPVLSLEPDDVLKHDDEHTARPAQPGMMKWAIRSLVLTALLALQVVYMYRNQLAYYPELRPTLETLCKVTACRIPPQRDTSKILLIDRAVRALEDKGNALLVTATLINQAHFPQPYPIVEFSIFDYNGNLVGRREFLPQEYLIASSPRTELMQPESPVELRLELQDPGEDTSAFEFNFR